MKVCWPDPSFSYVQSYVDSLLGPWIQISCRVGTYTNF